MPHFQLPSVAQKCWCLSSLLTLAIDFLCDLTPPNQDSCHIVLSLALCFIVLGEPVGVGSVAGGGRYDNLVGMFDPRGRKARQLLSNMICST